VDDPTYTLGPSMSRNTYTPQIARAGLTRLKDAAGVGVGSDQDQDSDAGSG
jgi:hypothetical protein